MKIKVLGTGCPKCKMLEQNAKKAAEELKIEATIEKVTDIQKIIESGVMMTPALEIDGKIVSAGKILTSEEIKQHLKRK
ncbi:redox-active disulfide protein [Candidatus Pacearchaeota archaeon RBG_13_36_9]|nr:MAG: redox-active disulfide protein [Candidatus Pacearchaeota archaeon RBG_13_36_9]HJX50092.1 thioredoxin family protein [Candidatus Nanoarchaeia archaeon]